MYFSENALRELKREYDTVRPKYEALMLAYVGRDFRHDRAKEFSQHGFSRRIKCMARSIENVFKLLPPELSAVPSDEQRLNAEINIQAFVLNTFGATDNLAWIWVSEKNLRRPDGMDIPRKQVGLRKELIRASFSAEFQEYLRKLDKWFGNLENFRDALAHRISLYIPPYMVDPKNVMAYREFEVGMNAALQRHDFKEHERMQAAQMKLCFFRPWMTHSFTEEAKHVIFHERLLSDFNVIDELGRKMLEELAR